MPVWLPGMLIGDNMSHDGYFPLYPYADGVTGAMFMQPSHVYPYGYWAGQIRFEGQPEAGDVWRLGGYALVSTSSRFDLDTEWNWLAERASTGTDDLALGDFNLLFRVA